jgi:FKBP-type peptidyl-prolyl cis-trans isomerase FklB
MKKNNIFMAVVLTALVAFSSCGTKPGLPTLKSNNDSLNYSFGLANGEGLKSSYFSNLKGDSVQKAINTLMAGIKEGMSGKIEKNDNPEIIDFAGKIGAALKQQEKTGLLGDSALKVDIKLLKQGMINGLKGSSIQMTAIEAQTYYVKTMNARHLARMEKLYGAVRVAGEKFIAENAKKAGVITTASGLQYEIIKKGTGALPTDNDRVKVNYKGTLIDGTVFDTNEGKEPVALSVNGVIKGWTEALKLMPVGSKYKLYIPQAIGYGEREQGKIKPFSALIFEVELVSIEKAAPASQFTPEQMQQLQQQMQQQRR